MQVPWLTHNIQAGNFYTIHRFISQVEFWGFYVVVFPEILLAKFAKTNAKVLHYQASSHAGCLWECNFTEVAVWITLLCITVSGLPPPFGRIFQGVCWPPKKIKCTALSTPPTTRIFPFDSDFLFWLRWLQTLFSRVCSLLQQDGEIQCHISHMSCCAFPEFCFSEHSGSQTTRSELLCLQFQVSFQLPFPVPSCSSREYYEYHSHHSVFLLPFCHVQTVAIKSPHCLTLCYQQCLCYHILRNHMEHWNPHLY